MPVIYREDGSVAWGMLAIFMVVLVVIMMVGYFAWYQPSYVADRDGPDSINITNPAPAAAPAQPAPNINVTSPAPAPAPNVNVTTPQAPAPAPAGDVNINN